MKKYGDLLPKLEYNGVTITDITHRFVMSKGIEKYKGLYFKTTIKQHQTPEVVSHVLYGTTDYWWVICAINNVMDPFYDWVMLESEVYVYAEKIYDDINDIHHWEDEDYNMFDSNNAEETLEPITNIEWEIYKNDKKLRINTIKPKHIERLAREFQSLTKTVKQQYQEG